MAKMKDLLKEFITAGGVVSRPAFSNLDMGFNTTKHPSGNQKQTTKLTDIVEDVYGEQQPKLNVREFMGEVSNFNSYGNEIYREGNLRELAQRLSRLAETAKAHTLQETEDWFDKITVNRNMKELTGLSNQFKKVATEAQALQERMSGPYEDMGHILSRYYEINESQPINQNEMKSYRDGDELEADTVQEGSYEEFFKSALEKWGVSEPDQLDDDEKSKFFNYVDANWSGENETD